MLRWIIRALAIAVFAFTALVILDYSELLVAVEPDNAPRWPTRSRPATGTSSLRV